MSKITKKYQKAKIRYAENLYFFCMFDDDGSSLEYNSKGPPKITINDKSNKLVKALISTLSNLSFKEAVLTTIRTIYLKDDIRSFFQISFLAHDESKIHFIKYIKNKLIKEKEKEKEKIGGFDESSSW